MSRLTIVSYAINGRGMGHLVRQLAILRQVRRVLALLDRKADFWVLTTSEADTLARREGFPSLKLPSKAMLRDSGMDPHRLLATLRSWTLQILGGLQPDLLLVDTFPGGSIGELVSGLELARHRVLVRRRVRADFAQDDAYSALLPLYDAEILPDDRGCGPILIRDPEELADRNTARAALGIPPGRRAVYVSLGGGGDPRAAQMLPAAVEGILARGWHAVVGAGPLYTGRERRGPGITWLDRYVPLELFAGLDAALSAGGYNSFHELMAAGVPTVFWPQTRIADDQEARADRAVAAGAGRRVTNLEEALDALEDPGDPAAARALVPSGGALRAALIALAPLVPADDLEFARRTLTPDFVTALARLDQGAGTEAALQRGFALVRLFGDDVPSARAERRATLLKLSDQGLDVSALPRPDDAPAATRLARFVDLCEAHTVSLDLALDLTRSLRRKFPAATGRDLLAAAETLLPTWAAYDDWMGAVSLLRAVPTQRTYSLDRFTVDLVRWLAGVDDLFEGLRAFARTEGGGARTVAETLHLLARDTAAKDTA